MVKTPVKTVFWVEWEVLDALPVFFISEWLSMQQRNLSISGIKT